jgi:hypothetical protein
MRIIKWLGIVAAIALIAACFFPWVYIKGYGTVSGISVPYKAEKPIIFHLFCVVLYLVRLLVNKVWVVYLAIIAAVINIGWAFRNFSFTFAYQGNYPVAYPAIYVVLISSIVMVVAILLTSEPKRKESTETPVK